MIEASGFATLDRLGPFLGRDRELNALAGHIRAGAALVSVVGMSGMGKTRLLLELLVREKGTFLDRSSFNGLTIHAELERISGQSTPSQKVIAIDDFVPDEHCDELLEAIGHRRGVTFIVATHEPLGLRGENVIELDGLSNDGHLFGIQLLLHHVRLRRPEFEHDTADNSVQGLVELVDGSPLGIEIIASRLHRSEPRYLLAELRADISSARRQSRDVPERHLSIESALILSLEKCRPSAVSLLEFLAFAGRSACVRTLIETWRVAGFNPSELLDAVDYLADRRIARVEGPAGAVMISIGQTFAAVIRSRKPSFDPALRQALCRVVGSLLEELHETGITSSVVERLDREAAVVACVLEHFRKTDSQELARCVTRLSPWWMLTGRGREAQHWAARALSLGPEDSLRWRLVRMISDVAISHYEFDVVDALLDSEAIRAEPQGDSILTYSTIRAEVALHRNDPELAISLLEAVDTNTCAPEIALRAVHLHALIAMRQHGNRERSVALLQQATTLAVIHHDVHRILTLRGELAGIYQTHNNEAALEEIRRTLEVANSIGRDTPQQAMLLAELAHTEYQRRRFVTAGLTVERALQIARRVCNKFDITVIEELDAIINTELRPAEESAKAFTQLIEQYRKMEAPRLRSLLADIAVVSCGLSASESYKLLRGTGTTQPSVDDYWAARRARTLAALERRLSSGERKKIDSLVATWTLDQLAADATRALSDIAKSATLFPGLSARESDVALLVGQALTDKEIAERLVLGVRTVNSHVGSILRKSGLSSRSHVRLWIESLQALDAEETAVHI